MIEFDSIELTREATAKIKVIGVGGAGGNTVNSIIEAGCEGIECVVVNTDAQALENSKSPVKIRLGARSAKGMGAGANPEAGKRAAEETLHDIMEHVEDADIVFLAAGLGGGTGSGALPVIAKALKERGILTIAVVTKPFDFEGKKRAAIADEAAKVLKQYVDTLIIMPNQNLLNVVDASTSMIDAFNLINAVLGQSVKSISEIITKPGHINVDFADVRTIMKDRGLAIMGTARASGPDRALEATLAAISSPLLESMNMKGSRSVLLNITGSKNLSLHEISQAASVIYDQADPDAQIILGSVIDNSLGDDVQVTIIATGFEDAQRALAVGQEIKVTGATCDLQCPVEPMVEVKPAAKPDPIIEKQPIATVLSSYKKNHEMSTVTELLVEGDELDAPTFMRAKSHGEKELE
ncbi:MAG: cell division protein FtsZ [Candidatus Babeliales bacterium]